MTIDKLDELKLRVDHAISDNCEFVTISPEDLADLIDLAEKEVRAECTR